jgi:DNA polymerase III alpha subunit
MLPLFKSHYSIGKSILTLNSPDKYVKGGADSVFKLAQENNFKKIILVEDSFNGFLQAKKNSEALDLQLVFGLRFLIAENIDEKLTRDNNNKHRIILFAKNDQGIKSLYKIYNRAFAKGFGHLNYKFLKEEWSANLKLAVPFYDSFLFANLVSFSNCVPDFSFCKPTFFIENNNLPFDFLVKPMVKDYCKENKFPIETVKSIYYNKKTDAKAFQTYKCLCSRGFGRQSTLEEPNLDHFGSNEFCFESWKKQNETT